MLLNVNISYLLHCRNSMESAVNSQLAKPRKWLRENSGFPRLLSHVVFQVHGTAAVRFISSAPFHHSCSS